MNFPVLFGSVAGEQQYFRILLSNALGQPFADSRVGPNFHRGIGKTHVAITHHVNGGTRLIFGDGECGVYIDLLWRLGRRGKKERARKNGKYEYPRTPPQGFSKW
jgi:hypothetical protein